mmetsp:Transcript_113875/g.207176  ORF Transcript_113875/g.207176 Transcript_113875/m.207176 type:complete len:166 (-) Transcript_113875:798-1295(-)
MGSCNQRIKLRHMSHVFASEQKSRIDYVQLAHWRVSRTKDSCSRQVERIKIALEICEQFKSQHTGRTQIVSTLAALVDVLLECAYENLYKRCSSANIIQNLRAATNTPFPFSRKEIISKPRLSITSRASSTLVHFVLYFVGVARVVCLKSTFSPSNGPQSLGLAW